MNTIQIMPAQEQPLAEAPPPAQQGPVCITAGLRSLPDVPRSLMARVPLPTHVAEQVLMKQFLSAPQFAGIDAAKLLRRRRGSLCVILLTETDYYARQAALYLATLVEKRRSSSRTPDPVDAFWNEMDDYLVEAEDPNALESALVVAHPAFLDPDMEQTQGSALQTAGGAKGKGTLALAKLSSPAVLIAAPGGQVLSPGVLAQIESLSTRDADRPLDVFIALKPSQVNRQLMEELRFRFGFQVCRVGHTDQDYLRRLLRTLAEDLNYELARDFDADQVLHALQRYRGAAFEETDLEYAMLWAVQNQAASPLRTQDLMIHPFEPEKTGSAGLEAMVGLTPVKDALRRLLSTAILEERRRMAGRPMETSCRNLAFSGPPGTGKSVTARLLARILMEEGVGTGRFVEAGREQLIGSYLGQTSPMVAKLFEKARGGVLFIDEAGALLSGNDQDLYATEAVNALVRHMELEPETLVIFATYPGEMEQLLTSNPGLSSRVAQVLDFPAYDDAQLWEILAAQALRNGYPLPQEAREACLDFFRRLRLGKGGNFGNGREARRLFQAAVEELALRSDRDPDADLTPGDLEAAASRLLEASGGSAARTIGF